MMAKKQTLLLCLIFVTISVSAQSVIQNRFCRNATSLNGKWHYIIDPYETGFYNYRYDPRDQGQNAANDNDAFFTDYKPSKKSDKAEYGFDGSPTLYVPGDWNSQDEKLLYYEGSIWYKKSFDYSKKDASNRVFIQFGAVNYIAHVYINGQKLGTHVGGFTPFSFEITDLLKEKDNFIVVMVNNNRKREAVPTLNTDWWNYGGITRDVDIIETQANFVKDYLVQLKKDSPNTIEGYAQLDGDDIVGKEITLSIPELSINKKLKTDDKGTASFEFEAKYISYWSPENPKLYSVSINQGNESIEDNIGFRTISVKDKDILLNGKSIFLRGICIHEENPFRGGRAYSKEDATMLLTWAQELGCNYVRLAHYPHNEYMLKAADEMGILVWEENPVYWTILFDNEDTYMNAQNQMEEAMSRDKNRASIIIWSMANETPRTEQRLEFLKRLAENTRKVDNTRLISAALEVHGVEGKEGVKTIDDPFAEFVDIISFNQYIGWYGSLPQSIPNVKWEITQNKPVVISEFGAGCLYGMHGDSLTIWSEEYQEDLYKKTIKMLMTIPQFRGVSPWILADFRSPKRLLPNIQDGWNRKGLISEKGGKKKAFYFLQNYYNQQDTKWK